MRRTAALLLACASAALLTAMAPPPAPVHPSATPSATPVDTTRWVIDAERSEARYLVREQLAGLDFPNDAVGRTRLVSGTLVVADGQVVPAASQITVDMASLETDEGRRDNYVRRRTLVTDSFPVATFVPRELRGVPVPLPASGRHTFQIAGDLTLKGVTRPVVWEAEADFAAATVDGTARVAFPFTLFAMEKPSVARVLSVADSIRLELDYRFLKAGGER